MKLKIIIILTVALIGLGVLLFESFIGRPDINGPVLKDLVTQLSAEGYTDITFESTLLGRYRIEAHSDTFKREIVIAPGTGAFLRDETTPEDKGDTDGGE